jgi:ribosomal protein S27E
VHAERDHFGQPGLFLDEKLPAVTGVYRPRHPERTALYRVLFHYFDRFLSEYESRFQREYGFLRPIIKEVVDRYLDCGNPRCGFARIRCPDCGEERLLMFSCRTRGFCPSCHAKRLEEWGEWMREELLLDVPHRQVVFTVPKMLRVFFKFNRNLCRLALRLLILYFEIVTGSKLMPGVIAAIQTFGDRINLHPLCRTPHNGWRFIFCPNVWIEATTPGRSSAPVAAWKYLRRASTAARQS